MGFFSDFADNILGINPNPVANGANIPFGWTYRNGSWQPPETPAAAPTPAAPTPAAPTPAAPPPAAPVSSFDSSPWRGTVDTAFSQFTPEFYANKYAEAYSPYQTGVQSQYGQAKDKLTSSLANKGLGGSSQSTGAFQQLDQLRDQELGKGQKTAQDFQTSLTGSVDTARKALYDSIAEGADNASVGGRAQSEASRLGGIKAPESTLGNVFGSLVDNYSAGVAPGSPAKPGQSAYATGAPLNLAGSSGSPDSSVKVVNKKKF